MELNQENKNQHITYNRQPTTADDEISLKELIEKIQQLWKFLLSRWRLIVLAGLIGGGIGLTYAFIKPIEYIARMTFVVEDSKSSAGGLASLAGQFGFDVGGSGGGGIFSGDNILLFLKSESLVRETLMTPLDEKGKETLADRYAEVMELKEGWLKKEKIGAVDFSKYNISALPRKEDSLLQVIEKSIIENSLIVERPEKKASFISVRVSTRDEQLSKLFTDRLVDVATDRYIKSKIKTKAANVAMLQRKADSLAAVLNNKTYNVATAQQVLVDANPALTTNLISSEISTREKTMALAVFAEVIKNLELSKTLLNQETPVIQIVDQSTFPLEKEAVNKPRSFLICAILSTILMVAFLLLMNFLNEKKVFV